jgi:hypothetical protein
MQRRPCRQFLIFPKGGTVLTQGPRPFNDGFAFAPAMPLLVIESNSMFLDKGWSLLRKPRQPHRRCTQLGLPMVSGVDDSIAAVWAQFEHELQRRDRG